jgi:hypothetical protein
VAATPRTLGTASSTSTPAPGQDTQRGLVKRIGQLKRLLGDSRVSAGDRADYESELSEASRLLDHSEQFVPRN